MTSQFFQGSFLLIFFFVIIIIINLNNISAVLRLSGDTIDRSQLRKGVLLHCCKSLAVCWNSWLLLLHNFFLPNEGNTFPG